MTFIQILVGLTFGVAGAVIITDVCSKLFSNEIALVVSLLLSFTWGYLVFPLISVLWGYFNSGRNKKINIWK